MLRFIRTLIPRPLLSVYHYTLAFLGALFYRFPSRKLSVVGITGTKGKSSTAEIVNAILEEAGHTTALIGTIRIKVGGESKSNLFKMTMPGRFFLQCFLRRAISAGCDYAIIEMTSEGAAQHRHRFIDLDALIFTNLAPEHIESHGSFDKYKAAKLKIRDALVRSFKKDRKLIVNADDEHADDFLNILFTRALFTVPQFLGMPKCITYSLKDAEPFSVDAAGTTFTLEGMEMTTSLVGEFALYNILAAASYARAKGVPLETIRTAVGRLTVIPGRAEYICCGQDFDVIIDYAHTKESLKALYKSVGNRERICVFGAAGGGRDKWKRPELGAVADYFCDTIILTDEDPYDEDPRAIVEGIVTGIVEHKPEIIMDRRAAIRAALSKARRGSAVLITGKGTDPFIVGKRGTKTPWSDREVAETELRALLQK